MKLLRKVGATSEIWQIFIADSSSTTGAGLTGLTNASSGLTAYYHRDTDTTATAISLVTMTVGTFTSSGFKEIDATNMPGWYQFCPPNAALASGAKSCAFHLKGATNMAPLPIEVDLDGQVDVALWNGTAVSSPATAGIPDVNVKNINNVAAATPGASGGILISGSNSGTTTFGAVTCTGSFTISDGLLVSRSSSNTSAITATGNGTGSGAVFTSGSGATGDGAQFTSAATNGRGVSATGNGSGAGVLATGGAAVTTTAAGPGVSLVGGAASTGAGGAAGLGLLATGGAGAASTNGAAGGAKFVGGGTNTVASSAHGLAVTGTSTGSGLAATSGAGATGDGITATAASSNGNGLALVSTGTGSGLLTDKLTASGAVAFQSTFAVTTSTSLAALSATTVTFSGAVAFQSTFATTGTTTFNAFTVTNALTVSGTTTLTGAVTASNAGNNITGVTVSAVGNNVITAASIADGAIDRATFAADTGLQTARSNTAAAGANGTITLDGSASATTDFYKGSWVYLTGNTGAGQARLCTAYNGSTKVATVVPNWATNPDNTTTFAVLPAAGVDVELWGASAPNALISGRVDANTQATAASLTFNLTGNITGNLSGTVTTVTTLTNLPSIPNNWLTAAGIASGALVAAVWDGTISGHTTTGTFGGALNAAGSAGDPWATTLPGAYSAGTAGHIIGTALPDHAPGANNGLLILGTNTLTGIGMVITSDTTDAVTYSCTASSGAAGAGLKLVGGRFQPGLLAMAGGTAGVGATFQGSGSQPGFKTIGGSSNGPGTYYAGGGASGVAFELSGADPVIDAGGGRIAAVLDSLAAAERSAVADALLTRSVAGGSDGTRTVSEALFALRNKVAVVGTTMTVYSTDDTTASWTGTLTTDAAADPITTVDPA